jgi:hypothetical protein
MSELETIRRLLVGDLRRVLRHRYGATLPDDDAGRDDLMLLLRLAAVCRTEPREKMQHEVELYAPWATAAEAEQWIDDFQRLDPRRVWLGGKELGERLNVTNAEREGLKAWRIVPVDISPDDLAEQRKAKDRERKRRKRAGAKPRDRYEAESLSKLKPWIADGISRRTWERRRGRVASVSAQRVLLQRNNLRQPPEEAFNKEQKKEERAQSAPLPSTADTLATPLLSTERGPVTPPLSSADTPVQRPPSYGEQVISMRWIVDGKKASRFEHERHFERVRERLNAKPLGAEQWQ